MLLSVYYCKFADIKNAFLPVVSRVTSVDMIMMEHASIFVLNFKVFMLFKVYIQWSKSSLKHSNIAFKGELISKKTLKCFTKKCFCLQKYSRYYCFHAYGVWVYYGVNNNTLGVS